MAAVVFKPATREASYARVALSGPSGAGKTYTALALATTLAERVAVIDTERGSASKYVGLNGWTFDTVQPASFAPLALVELLGVAAGAEYGAVIVDSLSHYWMGVDGMLEQADRRAVQGNTFAGWKAARPDERRMIDAIAAFPGHVIVTMRSKTEWVIEENERGKKAPRKVGLKPEQREGIEYEFDLVGDLDPDNTLTVVKSRIHTLARAVIPMPGEELAAAIAEWLSDGVAVPTGAEYRQRALASESVDELRALFTEVAGHRLTAAPTVDADGNPTVLGDLIRDRGNAVKNAAQRSEAEQEQHGKAMAQLFALFKQGNLTQREDQLVVMAELGGLNALPEHRDGVDLDTLTKVCTALNAMAKAHKTDKSGEVPPLEAQLDDVMRRWELRQANSDAEGEQ